MAGYWPSSLFCVFMHMDRDGVEVHKHAKKNELKEELLFNFVRPMSISKSFV